jgi:hypothetical protein
MWFPLLSALWRSRSANRLARRKQPSVRLTVEVLEDRTLPSAYTAANVSQLIASINAANATPEADTITLVAHRTYSLTEVNNTTHGPTGLPVIAAAGGSLTIVGNDATIQRRVTRATPAFRLFDVAPGASLTLQHLTLQGGLASGIDFPTRDRHGAALCTTRAPWPSTA